MSFKRSRANFESDLPAHHQSPFVAYGTPLPPLDSQARDDGSYVPLWKQEVRDERGRKRLHGAFTGGFSAGYFNTVGSKEGWTPSTFVSSRSDRRKDGEAAAKQRAEDFMDEEDLADAAEAQKLETQGSYAGLGSTSEDGVRRGFMSDLFKISGETMGVKLLQRMGWRQGQGIGPKVRRKARLDGQGGKAAKDEETHMFAPDDSRMVSFNKKTDRFGLGYAAEGRLGSAPSRSGNSTAAEHDDEDDEDGNDLFSLPRKAKAKSKSRRTGLGVGVLNDTGSDDDDPYEIGPKISYNRIIGGDKRKKKGGIIANTTTANPSFRKGASTFSSKLAQRGGLSGFRKCYDGRLPLDGFVLASSPLISDKENLYPPPKVPEGWKPSKLADTTSHADPSAFQSTSEAAKASTLNPTSRAALLGEAPLPGKSIFDFLTPAARERLAAATGKPNLPPAHGESAPVGFERSEAEKARSMWDFVPKVDKTTAIAALSRGTSGWMPYAEDEAKRARYRSFLEVSAGTRAELPERAKGVSVQDWEAEMREFKQAAEVFRPVTGLMASRFTSSSSAPKLASDAPEKEKREERKDPAEEAARLGMFGPMTRSRVQFFPTRLTCKRFNVKPPAHVLQGPDSGTGEEVAGSKDSRLDVISQTKLDQMMREASWNQPGRRGGADEETPPVAMPAVERSQPAVVDVEKNDALEGQRAGEAVFKAIFGSDDEDE